MATCPIQREPLQARLTEIQRIVDELNFNEFSNLSQWVEDLDERIRAILIARLEEHLTAWTTEFTRYNEGAGGKLITYKTVLEVKIQNQMITLEPPIAEARAYWYRQLHEQLEIVCGL